MAAVLIVEDDATVRGALVRALGQLPHVPSSAGTAMEGLRLVLDERPDVVLLDLTLPDLDGSALLSMIRAVSKVPVIVISARDDDRDIVALLDAGADDYLVKPFTSRQLEARIRAVLRRTDAPPRPAPLVVGGLCIDPAGRSASLDGRPLLLSPKEFDLLAYLAEHLGQVVTKRTLAAEVWNQPYGGSDKTFDVHVHWLRRKLGETADHPKYLHRVRGVGVKLVDPRP
ncbi:MAG TPA: response regulator transcription factor [Nocardioidaceae bacterium]|nr:response regulator transcription factor [Nocardioidaceae bacterium]